MKHGLVVLEDWLPLCLHQGGGGAPGPRVFSASCVSTQAFGETCTLISAGGKRVFLTTPSIPEGKPPRGVNTAQQL